MEKKNFQRGAESHLMSCCLPPSLRITSLFVYFVLELEIKFTAWMYLKHFLKKPLRIDFIRKLGEQLEDHCK